MLNALATVMAPSVRSWTDRALPVAAVVPITLAGLWATGVRYNPSASVPRGVYLVRPFVLSEVDRGAYVCLRASADAAPSAVRGTEWGVREQVLLKRAAGLPGDQISYERDAVVVNGARLAHSKRLAQTSTGEPLPSPTLPYRLRADELWLSSSDAGYDSRYFGPVHRAALSCIAEPLWTF